MSKLVLKNGDDHPEAAEKHLMDAGHLLTDGRPDGAAYLSGYVVECAIKSLIVLENAKPPASHNLPGLAGQIANLALLAGSKTAKYFGPATQAVASAGIASWGPGLRYRAPTINPATAAAWHAEANAIFRETVAQMKVDGVI